MRRRRFVVVLGPVLVLALWATGTAASATPTSDAQTTCLARTTKVTVTGKKLGSMGTPVRRPQIKIETPADCPMLILSRKSEHI